MSIKMVAAINAFGFFFFWLVVLLAGSDRPPAPGFLWLIPVFAASALVVYWRIPTYVRWSQNKLPYRLLRVSLEGLWVGLVVATPFALFGSDEPSIPLQPIAYLVWFAVLGLMGMLNSLALYVVNALMA